MESDLAKLAAREIGPRLEDRLDRIVAEVIAKFKGGNLTQDGVQQYRADWLATSRLHREILKLAQEEKTNG